VVRRPSASQSLLLGEGYRYFDGGIYAKWPPLFPTLLAALHVVGLEPVAGARFLNAFAFGMIVYVSGRLFLRCTTSVAFALPGVLSIILSAPLVAVSIMVWSEPVFAALAALFTLAMPGFLRTQSRTSLVSISLLAALACLRRYAGVTLIPDCWLYIHEPCVKMGRIQVFNNWSPYLVRDETKVWVGLEYFCTEGDQLWNMSDRDFAEMAIEEMARIGFIDRADVLDSTVIRMPKAYPAYTGTYKSLDRIRDHTDRFENLFLIGQNGMHRYNNADHSMLSAMAAVDNIIHGVRSKDNIWAVNAEEEYHEAASQMPDQE